jgi:hypothetical protein
MTVLLRLFSYTHLKFYVPHRIMLSVSIAATWASSQSVSTIEATFQLYFLDAPPPSFLPYIPLLSSSHFSYNIVTQHLFVTRPLLA